ncbi:hypothetical protein COCCU_05595 [Corynebacterium occultum]|uniref:Uncharacterized protein n=1 Tax=Corynebacterium occultum TaxID=2675219 RepID=A0A6B8VSC7_9CORY|nr:hypothetical protein [Corynebacterium occultum]QGU07063.1 hypothetical protein COCCU_05595 [Corynebacterium occultum]
MKVNELRKSRPRPRVLALTLSGITLAGVTLFMAPTASAISVSVKGEKCSFEVSETDIRATLDAEEELQEAVHQRLIRENPDLEMKFKDLHQWATSHPDRVPLIPNKGYVARAYDHINERGMATGFHDGELPETVINLASLPAAHRDHSLRYKTATLVSQDEWDRSNTRLFLNFQPLVEDDLDAYWPARIPGASEGLLDLQIQAAKDIDYLDHIISVNAAYHACAEGYSGKFPLLAPGEGDTTPKHKVIQDTTSTEEVLAAAPRELNYADTVEETQLAESSQPGQATGSLITLAIAILVGMLVVLLPYRSLP